jgi:hypothetical protein
MDCGAVDGMRISGGSQNTRTKPAPVPFFQPKIPHEDLGSMTGHRDRKPATKSLSCGMAYADEGNKFISLTEKCVTNQLMRYYRNYNENVGPWPLFQLLDPIHTVGRTPWTGD